MSKKVLNYAGRRPMLLAFIMAMLTLGLLFSGWLAPMPGRAQTGNPNPTPNVETTNCVVSSITTNCMSEATVTLSNIPPTVVCLGSGVGASTGTMIGDGVQSTTTCYTNSGNSGDDKCSPETIYTTNSPTMISNWWTASGCGIGTNGTGLSTGSTPMIPTNAGQVTITFYQKWKHVCDTNTEIASVQATVNVVHIQHQCVATTPADQSRLMIGVGETVNLDLVGIPGAFIFWDYSPKLGILSGQSGSSVTFTAPDGWLGGDSLACTIKASYLIPNGVSGSCSITFEVLKPTSINMRRCAIAHSAGTVHIGMQTYIYVAPATVNFGTVSVHESPAKFNGNGVYDKVTGNLHGSTVDNPSRGQVDSGRGTWCLFTDTVEVGGASLWGVFPPVYDPVNGSGKAICAIPCRWKSNNGSWFDFAAPSVIEATSSGSPSHMLTISKSGASWSCSVYSPTVTFPPN